MEKEGNELKSPLHLKLEWNKRESAKVKRNAWVQVYFADSDTQSCGKFHQQWSYWFFNAGNIRAGKSGAEMSMDVCVGYLQLSLVFASFSGSVSTPPLPQLCDNAPANTEAEIQRHWH